MCSTQILTRGHAGTRVGPNGRQWPHSLRVLPGDRGSASGVPTYHRAAVPVRKSRIIRISYGRELHAVPRAGTICSGMARLWLVAALLCVLSTDALRIAGPQLVQRNVLTLRGGASPTASTGLTQSWLRVLRRIVFPGNPPRARAPPAEAAPSPAAAASKPAARTAPRTGKRTRSKAGGAVGSVHSVHSKAEFDQLLASTPQKQLVVVDFAASWCGPCQQIAPKFAAMAADMPHVRFVKVAAARTHQPLASHAHVARARTRAAAPVWLHTLCLLVCVCGRRWTWTSARTCSRSTA